MLVIQRKPMSNWWSAIVCAAVLLLAAGTSELPAQEAAAPPAEGTPAAEPAAAPATPAPATEAAGEEHAPKTENLLMWIARTSGWIGAVLLGLSFYFVAVTAESFMRLRMSEAMPMETVAQADALVKAKDYQTLFKFLKEDPSFYAQVTAAGLTELQMGWSEAREAMEDVGEAQIVDMERRISMLAVLGTLGPMIGLLGTLKGMISSFSVIAMSDTQMKASEVAHGISEALLLTFEGVALSVPAIWLFAYFKNRIAGISSETMISAMHFMRQLNVLVRPAKPNAPAAATKTG